MQLFITQTSPYVRQCRIVAREKHVRLEERPIGPEPRADAAYLAVNPAGHGPALVTDEGLALTGQVLICAYLDSQGAGPALCDPADWADRRLQTLADQATAFLVAMSGAASPPPAGDWLAGLARCLDVLEVAAPSGLSMGAIATATALTYADFRLPHLDWGTGRPALVALQSALELRESFRATAPGA